MNSSRLILGIGNQARGDDAAGIEVVRRLAKQRDQQGIQPWDLHAVDGEPTRIMDAWSGYDEVVAVDAVVTGTSPAGTMFHFDVTSSPLPVDCRTCTSHALGLADAIELARTLGKLPSRTLVIGIEGADYGFSETLSPAVEQAVQDLVERFSSTLMTEETFDARIFFDERSDAPSPSRRI